MPVVKHSLPSDKAAPVHRAGGRIVERLLSRLRTGGCYYAGTEQKPYTGDIFNRIGAGDVCRLARHLATLLHAGMPLVPALSALAEQLQAQPLGAIVKELRRSVNAGSTLAEALEKYPDVFSGLFVGMVSAGQAGGNLEEVLLGLAEMLEKRVHLARQVKSAIAYPAMMVAVAVGVVVFLLSFVVPGITEIFIEMDRALPWPTRLLISTSGFIKTYLLLILIAICGIAFVLGIRLRNKEVRLFWDRCKLKLPLFGGLLLKLETARLARTLGTLLAGGTTVLKALDITKRVVQNSFVANAMGSVRELVNRGDDLAGAMRKTGLFPPIVFHVIATSQVGANLEDGLLNIADMYDGEVETAAKTLLSLLEPAILLVMGVIIGFIVLAVLLPIFEINQVL